MILVACVALIIFISAALRVEDAISDLVQEQDETDTL